MVNTPNRTTKKAVAPAEHPQISAGANHLHLWHMTTEDYARCRSDVSLSEGSLTHLSACENTPLAPTAQAIRDAGYDGYQELMLSELLADLIES